ncbi:MAG: type II secretion system protein [Actinomycetia bacterium]|nr:type II secretion system protein [Actinomycetes bacterium]MCP4845810.1 type II secretion system protein [Actinomycetes bacterium]
MCATRPRGFSILEMVAAVLIVGVLAGAAALVTTRLIGSVQDVEPQQTLDSVVASQQTLHAVRGVFAGAGSGSAVANEFEVVSGASTGPAVVSLTVFADGSAFGATALSPTGECYATVAGPRESIAFGGSDRLTGSWPATGPDSCTAPATLAEFSGAVQ